ncbi:MAG: malate dehydrogenase [Chloroflexi bacterium RBG_16_68_14]|nr:MAG: malate dehydrogenase [Chloroflexi bacterium RBG_16_68_14]
MSARKKVTIVGAGMTGGAIAQRLVEKGYCDVVLQDEPSIVETMHHGKALDLAQSAAWAGFDSAITATDGWEETAGSEVIVFTAGAPRKPGMSREELLNNNAAIVRDKVTNAVRHSPDAVLIIFANPMDAMCHVALGASKFPRERVMGQGGMLDSARYRTFVSRELGVSIRDVHGYVLGGHTDTTMVPIVSATMVGGVPLTSLLPKERVEALVERTMKGGAEVLSLLKTGSAYQAPAAATIQMVEAIVLDQHRLIPCSVYLQGEYGIKDVFCGTIVKLGTGGIQQVYEVPVSEEELSKIRAAAEANKELIGLLEPAKA